MEWLANVVGGRMTPSRPVVDRTGLAGAFDIAWVPPALGAPLVSSLETQLGLSLQPREEALDLLVVDRIERPRVTP